MSTILTAWMEPFGPMSAVYNRGEGMKKNPYQAPFAMAEVLPPVFPERTVRVAWTDGDAGAIQQAIDDCAAQGGGTVAVAEGYWLSGGPLVLRSNIRLQLEAGTMLEFSDRFEDYLPVVLTRWEGIECYNYSPLIYARDCENIAIVGKGALLGRGTTWWNWKKRQGAAAEKLYRAQQNHQSVEERRYGTEEAALRPSFIQPFHCKNVQLEGLTIVDGPQWTVHPVYCENVLIQNMDIQTHGHNTDGLNPDSCRNVVIEGCRFYTGDDCIAINSGMNEDGRRVNRPCENIIIRNNQMLEGHGAIVIGSGMSGGVQNVYACNNQIQGGMWGIRIKSMRGRGGYIKDIWMEDMEISNIRRSPIQISMFYDTATVEPTESIPPVISGIHLKNIRGRNNQGAVDVIGLPEQPMQDVTFEEVHFSQEAEVRVRDAEYEELK